MRGIVAHPKNCQAPWSKTDLTIIDKSRHAGTHINVGTIDLIGRKKRSEKHQLTSNQEAGPRYIYIVDPAFNISVSRCHNRTPGLSMYVNLA